MIRALAGCAAVLLVAGCASVTGGDGTAGTSVAPSGSRSPDFPSGSAVPTTPASSAAPSTPPATFPSTIAPAERRAALVARAAGEQVSDVVAVPGGYEAATFDQRGAIRFWSDPAADLGWLPIGASRYPYSAALGAPGARVSGARLRNMTHATFIVTGLFTTDGSGNAVAFTTGARGWGAIKAERNGNIGPSGAPVGRDRIGLSYGFAFAGGYLVTGDCPQNRPIAQCGRYPVVKRWVWTGRDFRRVR
ncbi:MAG TPA: hypothetical protein VHC23_08280 [Jatrophihabitans sp.]|nr:hypothetical protein [Jatrophihabitans sp.]